MRQSFARLGQGQRALIFFLFFVGGLLALIALTVFLILLSVNTGTRTLAVALGDDIQVNEFSTLPDDDAYPRSVAVAPDGTVYTGSYVTGTLWRIDGDKPLTLDPQDTTANRAADAPHVREIDGTRERIGSVRGLAFAPDGTLYILDGVSSDPRGRGGMVWAWSPVDDTLREVGEIERQVFPDDPDDDGVRVEGFMSPWDITVDGEGWVYVSDRGWREVWRIDPQTGENRLWWTPPTADGVPSGLAYDATHNALIVTDSELNTVHRIDPQTRTDIVLYAHIGTANLPGLDGVSVTPDGVIYAAAIDQAGIVQIIDGELRYIVGTLRGASDVTVAPDGALYFTHFDSRSMVLPGVEPQLPFALDVARVGR